MQYKRILILGSPGSGKTTLAITLSKILNYPIIHLDYYFRVASRKNMDVNYVREKMLELVKPETWIIEGNYLKSLDIRLKRADYIIFLDLPTKKCLKQAYQRFIQTKGKQRFDAPKGMIDYRFDNAFKKYILDFKRIYQPRLFFEAILKSQKPYTIIKNRQDIKKLLTKIKEENDVKN